MNHARQQKTFYLTNSSSVQSIDIWIENRFRLENQLGKCEQVNKHQSKLKYPLLYKLAENTFRAWQLHFGIKGDVNWITIKLCLFLLSHNHIYDYWYNFIPLALQIAKLLVLFSLKEIVVSLQKLYSCCV